MAFTSCKNSNSNGNSSANSSNLVSDSSSVEVDRFADIRVLKYEIPGWDKLSLDQKKLVYYLTQAGFAGRDIIWDQNYRYNLEIRSALENIVQNYTGDKTNYDWNKFMDYTKQIWFANGISDFNFCVLFLCQFHGKKYC